jgi:predicted alpha/beta hydrolase family esterase
MLGLGTLLVTRWLAGTKVKIGGALLVAVPLHCPSIVVAESWGSRLVNIGKAGHINAASGLGEWTEGHRLLESPRTRIE